MKFIKRLFGQSSTPHLGKQNQAVIQNSLATGKLFFEAELQDFLGVDRPWVMDTQREFAQARDAWRYLSQYKSPSHETDGVGKSLDVSEGFALWAVVKRFRPRVIVELGVNRGISARLWKEALNFYVPEHRLILCDLEDHRQVIGDGEAEFVQGDAYVTLKEIFREGQVDLLYNDAHPYSLIEWSVKEAIKHGVPIFGFHDTGNKHPRGPYRAASASLTHAEKLKNDENWAEYGTWERHVIGEVFDERALEQEAVEADKWKIRHFDSLFGTSVVVARERLAHG